jgi:hypothetical protein
LNTYLYEEITTRNDYDDYDLHEEGSIEDDTLEFNISNYDEIIPQNIDLTNPTTATITFPTLESGYAVATVGGTLSSGNTYITNNITNSINTGSLATTGSNTFNGNQTVNGSIILDNGAVIKDNENNSISFGYLSAEINQGTQSVAIGNGAGYQNQSNGTVAVGTNAGAINQGLRAVALGSLAGSNTQGEYAIAIGNFAGPNNQASHSIVISATGTGLDNTIPNSLVIAPIRNVNGDNGVLQYNTTTNEVSYATTLNGITNLATTGSVIFTGNQVVTGSTRGNITALSIDSNTASLNLSTGNFFTLQLVSGSNTYINPSNILPGQTSLITLYTTGSATVSFPSSVKQPSGSAYVPTTSTGVDILTLASIDSTSLYVIGVKNMI